MRLIRGRGDARWLPSRHNFALFRLAAYLFARSAKPEPSDAIFVVDRHQSTVETYAVSLWVLFTLTCYVAATLFASWPVPLALAAALPVAAVAAHVPFFVTAAFLAPFTMRDELHLRAQSFLMMLTLLGLAGWFATRPSWVRFAAWQFLGFAALNAVAAAIVFTLRGSIARLENAIGGLPSEP